MTTTRTLVSPLGSAALLYASVGWLLVPLHTPGADGACDCHQPDAGDRATHPIGKHPRTRHGLADATTDTDTIVRWWQMWPDANIGVDLARSGLVDVAPDSIEWFAEFTARGLPPTLRFASGGGEGHAHHLYARPEGCAIYRDCQTGEYDVMSNGYAVMPPSLHVSGRTYTWESPADGVVLTTAREPSPAWVIKLLNERSRRTVAAQAVERDTDAPPVELRGEALERWYGRVFEAKPSGAVNRSDSLWKITVDLLEAGCNPKNPALLESVLAERDAALGWEKFTNRRDIHTRYRIIVARAVAGQGPGRIRLKPKPKPEPQSQLGLFMTAAELADVEEEEIRWYAFGQVGSGLVTELDGKVKQAGKSTLLAALCRSILEGEHWLGQPTRYTPIVYLTEQSGPSFKRNLKRAGLLGRHDLHVLLWSKVLGWKWEDVVMLARRKAAAVGAGILIVDTLGQFSGVRGDGENSSGSAMVVMEPLQAAASDELAVVVSRHDRKSGGDVGDSGRGSSAYAGAVDVILHLQRLPGDREGKERQRLLEAISRFEETPDQTLIELGADEPYEYRAIGDVEVVRAVHLRAEVLANLATDPDLGLGLTDLRELLSCDRSMLSRTLWELMKERLIGRTGDGKRGDPHKYFLRPVEEGDDAD
jgi:hypothetical protein